MAWIWKCEAVSVRESGGAVCAQFAVLVEVVLKLQRQLPLWVGCFGAALVAVRCHREHLQLVQCALVGGVVARG